MTSPESALPQTPDPVVQPRAASQVRDEEGLAVVSDSGSGEEDRDNLPFPIVGIGASAGGLEAFTSLLEQTPRDTGMAFVIASHLPSGYHTLLPEILSRSTSMPVFEIEDGMIPAPNQVYVVPSGSHAQLREGRLHLRRRSENQAQSIDVLFTSLGEEQKSRAIGIVLSGNDSDGTLGLKAIKGEGGISIVQDENTAQFDSMPRHAIAGVHVDLILPPAQIGAELGRIAYDLRQTASAVVSPAVPETEETVIADIYRILRSSFGIDFSRYKQSTLRRRIARRMVLMKTGSLSDYQHLLREKPSELRDLYEDVLIGVTKFFRDPEVFATLKSEIVPNILRNRPEHQYLRIWVAGCATGEEVYSIAIAVLEALGTRAMQTPIQIFGTDISERSIEKARFGIYPDTIAADVSSDRLRRFFTKHESGYQVSKRIRELCVFSKHNLIKDPPFSRLDLVSCRNVLIYLGAPAQKAIVAAFHYALNEGGMLLLGQSETIREFGELFELRDRRNKVYLKKPGRSRLHLELLASASAPEAHAFPEQGRMAAEDGMSDVDLQRATDRVIVARYGPPGVVVDEQMEVIQTRGDTSPFLMLPSGTVSLNVLRMAKEGLGASLREALERSMAQDIPVVIEDVPFKGLAKEQTLSIEVLPIQNAQVKRRNFLVFFVQKPNDPDLASQQETADRENRSHANGDHAEVPRLREDLASTKFYLQSLVEDRDAKNQELISANEEIQSSNEELQSINEELETAKEELQSQAEELQTVNEEMHRRNNELSRTTSDLVNLLNNITMPVLILGADFAIRQFTPTAERILSVRQTDIGRNIRDMRLNLRVNDLEPLLSDVVETLATKEIEVQDREGRWYLLRAKPYRTVDNKIDGVVIVLIDIDQIQRTQEQLREAHQFARTVIDSTQVPLVVLDAELTIRTANRAFLTFTGQLGERVEGRSFSEVAMQCWNMEGIAPILTRVREHEPEMGGLALEHDYDGGKRTLLLHAQATRAEGKPGVVLAVEDITVRKQAQQLLRREKDRLQGQVQLTEAALRQSHEELQRLTARLFSVQEDERRRIARDLHDDLSQKLAMLEMTVDQIEQRPTTDSTTKQQLASIHTAISTLLEQIRRISHQLHPQILDDLGLPVALQRLAEEFEAAEDMPVRLTVRALPESIPRDVATCLYRIAQEALHNISKHAGNAPVHLLLAASESGLRLCVRDEGDGFDMSRVRQGGGLGLVSIQERARLLAGSVSLASEVGVGTTVEVTIPIGEVERT